MSTCVDCSVTIGLYDGLEWPSCGPICYTCLDARREKLESEVAEVRARLKAATQPKRKYLVTPYNGSRPFLSNHMCRVIADRVFRFEESVRGGLRIQFWGCDGWEDAAPRGPKVKRRK